MYYLSGQIALDLKSLSLIEGGIEAQTERTLLNIQQLLANHGLTLGHIIKSTVILSDIDDFSAFNRVYSRLITHKPARTTFAASGLVREAKIEIDVMAYKADSSD